MRRVTAEFLAHHRAHSVPALTDALVSAIVADNPGYRAVPVVPVEDLRSSCRDNIARVLELLEGSLAGGDLADGPWYDAAEATGSRRAEQGLPLDDVLGSFRIGGRLIWESLVDLSEGEHTLEAGELREIGTRLWEVVDRTSSHVARAYHATERDLVRADEQRRAALWEELLGGRARDPGFAASLVPALGLPVEGPFVVVTLSGTTTDLTGLLQGRGIASAWHRRTDAVVGILALGAAGLEPARERLARSGARCGISAVIPSLAEVDQALGQALTALRTLPAGVSAVACFDDRLLEGLLLGAADVSDRLVARWLGPLLALPGAERRVLLSTVEAWVAAGGSMTRTAELAHCHRNTAMNRVARFGELLGVPLGEGVPPVELQLALRWHALR